MGDVFRRTVAVATLVATAAVVVAASPAAAVPVPWKNCATAAAPITVTSFDASVWPPVSGQPITFSYRGTVARSMVVREDLTISGSRWLTFGVHRSGVRLSAGPFASPPGGLTFTVPKFIPPGTVLVLNFTMHDTAGALVFCLDATVPFK
jgi:hypothetical protein